MFQKLVERILIKFVKLVACLDSSSWLETRHPLIPREKETEKEQTQNAPSICSEQQVKTSTDQVCRTSESRDLRARNVI